MGAEFAEGIEGILRRGQFRHVWGRFSGEKKRHLKVDVEGSEFEIITLGMLRRQSLRLFRKPLVAPLWDMFT